ncbi:MAG: endonuclease V [Nitrospirae bacterium]|nr:MAG: endonuclease V [Nitrospirota bacterium]
MKKKKRPSELIAAVDVSYQKSLAFCGVVLMKSPELEVVQEIVHKSEVSYPYVPGYLYLREGPVMVQALKKLNKVPDVVLVDGQGTAHPRGYGLACYVGERTGLPTIGCAKSRLVGEYEEPGQEKGSWSPLYYEGRVVGAVVRTRTGVRPVFVSPGYGISLEKSIEVVLSCSKYRIPEPLRLADHLSRTEPVQWQDKS